MTLKEILAKIAKGEALTPEEKAFIESYNPDDAGRIPKSRLDEEINKRKDAETRLTEQQTQIDQLNTKIEELENKDLSEAEKTKKASDAEIGRLREENKTLKKDRDTNAARLTEIEFNGKMSDLAGKHRFVDANYLGHLVKSNNVNLEDAEAVSSFIKGLEQSSPGLFKSTAKPGSGTKLGDGVETESTETKRLKELLAKPELTNQEATEVIGLQDKITETAAGNGDGGKATGV